MIWALLACGGAPLPRDTASVDLRATGLERALHAAVNDRRAEAALEPLIRDPRIGGIARAHSRDMAAGRARLGHAGSDDRTAAIAEFLPVLSTGENVTYNIGFDDPVAEAMAAWRASAPHDANLVDDFTHAGLGVVVDERGGHWFTAIFVLPL